MKRWLIEKLGGYPDVDAALWAVREMEIDEKRRWLTLAVKRLFNTIGPDDILKIHQNGQWTWQGKPMRMEEVQLLKAEALQFQTTFLWKVLQKELRYQANKRMYIESETQMDMVAGKLLGYYIDIIETRLKRIEK